MLADEAQNYATSALASIFDEARKYRASLALATQFSANLPEHVRDAVFGKAYGFDDSRRQPKLATPWPLQLSPTPTKRDIRAEFCAALASYESGDGLSASKSSARYAPRILADTIKGVPLQYLASIMGAMLAEGRLQIIKVSAPGRPSWTKLVVKPDVSKEPEDVAIT